MSQLDVRCLDGLDDIRRCNEFVRKSPAGTVFSAPSWLDYVGAEKRVYGVFKGDELVAGLSVPLSGGRILRVVPETPWTGICARSNDEGENLSIAEAVARHLLREFGDVTLTLPPDWVDVRGFVWQGMRQQVRYTYIGEGKTEYEKRVRVRPAIVSGEIVRDRQHENDWWIVTSETGDTKVTCVCDWRTVYYWKANIGGSWHTECVDGMINYAARQGLRFDMVGCNSPHRGLFKRQFGGRLTPYYVVTTADPRDIAEFWPPQEAQVA